MSADTWTFLMGHQILYYLFIYFILYIYLFLFGPNWEMFITILFLLPLFLNQNSVYYELISISITYFFTMNTGQKL
jgi:hypothetical protein